MCAECAQDTEWIQWLKASQQLANKAEKCAFNGNVVCPLNLSGELDYFSSPEN